MSNLKEYGGLCVSCRNDPTCIFPREAGRPILQCDLFEGFPVAPVMSMRQNLPPMNDTWIGSNAEDRGPSKYLGLCSNCKVRRTCIYPKPEGGVWRCEMYE